MNRPAPSTVEPVCPRRRLRHGVAAYAAALGLLVLAGCGGGSRSISGEAAVASPSAGQVTTVSTSAQLSFYAASRLAEQASFGPTPALVAEIRSKGVARWIDDQIALPFEPIDHTPAEAIFAYPDLADLPASLTEYPQREFANRALGAHDQLRLRLTWALSQFITAAPDGQAPTGGVTYVNVLYRHALGNYRDLLLDMSTNRTMGAFLNNDQNRPKSDDCPSCAPNENYARELMQLFSIGVIKLQADGTPLRDNRGRLIETYTQRDVEELARVLTGWTTNPDPPNRPPRNQPNWSKPMVPSTWRGDRDSGRKVVLGRVFPAGQSTRKDLEDAVDLLMNHPNVAPFVATRLIQHLVKSNPTPAYVGRVAARFVDNGQGVRGDLAAVARAILTDVEARAADNPAAARGDEGKIREPWLHRAALWRGLGCTRMPVVGGQWVPWPDGQVPFRPSSVFSFYAPTDRAPSSNLLAPEQKLLLNNEIRQRLGQQEWARRWNPATSTHDYSDYAVAGCKLDELSTAFSRSPTTYGDWLSERYFRGAMPPTLRSNLEQLMRQSNPPWSREDPNEGALRLLGFALNTPYFGAIR